MAPAAPMRRGAHGWRGNNAGGSSGRARARRLRLSMIHAGLSRRLLLCPCAVLLALIASCGGKAVIDSAGSGGSGGSGGGTTTTSTTTSTSSSTSTHFCSSHADCQGGLCVFATGHCAQACTPNACDSCQTQEFCEPCATASCALCDDCVAACAPLTSGRCDDNDPCSDSQVCEWYSGVCLPTCGPNGDCGGFAYCDYCATSSCCGCKDCASACVGGE